jgi:hypothetical protein
MPQQDSRRSRAPHLFPGRVTAWRRDADAGSRTSSRKSLSLPRLRFVSRAAREGPRTATAPYVSTASGSGPEHAHATDRQEGSPRLWDWSVRDPAPIIHQSLECCIPCRPHGRRSRREECSGEAPVSCRATGQTRSSRKIEMLALTRFVVSVPQEPPGAIGPQAPQTPRSSRAGGQGRTHRPRWTVSRWHRRVGKERLDQEP